MKKKVKALLLTLGLSVAALSITACGETKDLYDLLTSDEVKNALENLGELDAEDFENIADDFEDADSMEDLMDGWNALTGNDDSSDVGTDSESTTDDDLEDGTSTATDFEIGTIDGSVYTNAFLGIQCEQPGYYYYSTAELATLNNVTVGSLEEAGAEMDENDVLIIMYAQNQDTMDSVNITIQYFGFNMLDYYTVEDMIDSSLALLETTLTSQGVKNVTATRSTTTFLGETVPCVEVTGSINDIPLYEKQVFVPTAEHIVTITTACVSGEDNTQTMLDAFIAY